MFKELTSKDGIALYYPIKDIVSISKNSQSASFIHFLTGIKSLGNINYFDVNTPQSFGLTVRRDIQYEWGFNKKPTATVTAERTVGVFLSSGTGQQFNSSSNTAAGVTHSNLYNYTQGYLYRNDSSYSAYSGSLSSVSDGTLIPAFRVITMRRDLLGSSIEQRSLRIEVNTSNTSTTGIATGSKTAFTSALDLKNTKGVNDQSIKSFAGVRWWDGMSASLDTCTGAFTIEAIIRPYSDNSVILWRRLSSSAWSGSTAATQNSFIKLELTKSADKLKNAFRLYIRTVTANDSFTESFAKSDVQASGLFVPEDVGINLFDGRFHHIITSWSNTGLEDGLTTESGAGAVLGYVDGYKLLNREQVDPRLDGADIAHGPTVQANMFDQRIPVKTSPIEFTDPEDPISGNNLYIGISNYNRTSTDTFGDKGDLTTSADPYLAGGYDGQIQHIRMWNVRFSDGTTSILHDTSKKVSASSTAGQSFNHFVDNVLTGDAISTNIVGWWSFNELNTTSANDLSIYSNTAALVGIASINLYDHYDISTSASKKVLDAAASTIHKTYLYIDSPEKNIINNGVDQGRLIRIAADGSIMRLGLVYYDTGIVTIDNDDDNAKLYWTNPVSGTTGDFGFSVTGLNNVAFNVERLAFNSVQDIGRSIFTIVATGDDFNYTSNPSGVSRETGANLLDDPTTYVTEIGLYNDNNDLLAVAKLSNPVKKDSASQLTAKVTIDY